MARPEALVLIPREVLYLNLQDQVYGLNDRSNMTEPYIKRFISNDTWPRGCVRLSVLFLVGGI